MKAKFLFLAVALLMTAAVKASQLPVSGNCDTLFTKDGKSYLITYHAETKTVLEYSLCNDSTNQHYTLPKKNIKKIAFFGGVKKQVKTDVALDPLEKMAKSAMIFSVAGTAGSLVMGILGIGFMIAGAIRGEKALRKLKDAGSHPSEETIKRRARTAVMLPFLTFFVSIAIYLLFVFLI